MPIDIPSGVEVDVKETEVRVKGPKGELSHRFPPVVEIKREGEQLIIGRTSVEKFSRAMHGTARAVISNMVVGVSDGFSKTLEVHGVGYRPEMKGKTFLVTSTST